MARTLIEKAKNILDGLEYGYFDTAKDWSNDNYDDYYRYLSDPDFEIRKYSLLVFTAALGNWYMKSAFVFGSLKELKKDPEYQEDKTYDFGEYVKSFLNNRESIKREFPELYRMIVLYLIELDNERNFEEEFCFFNQQLLIELRQALDDSGFGRRFQYGNVQKLLKELGLPNFAKDE